MTAKPKRDIFDKITLAVAIAGVIVITWQSVETDRAVNEAQHATDVASGQLRVMQGQLGEMRLEQRPWLKIEASASDSYDQGGGKIWAPHLVNLEITNTGKTPAFFVNIDFDVIDANGHSAAAAQATICAHWRGTLGRRQIERGPTLFPGQSMTMSVGADLNPAKIAEAKKIWENAVASGKIQRPPGYPHKELIFSPESFLYPQFYGCINYKSKFDHEWHQTGFIYDILRTPGVLPKNWKIKKPTWTPWYDSLDKGAYFAN